jgi:hypothetical protein
MRVMTPVRLAVALLLGLLVASPRPARAADDKKNVDKVTFETVDGVKISGTFYPSPKGKNSVCVLLLHNVGKGGHSHVDGWDYLAEELQKKDYAVLSFDFRGHGDSKTMDSGVFWKQPFNSGRNLTKVDVKSTALDYTQFKSSYYPYLINDIMAARAHLDQRHDAGDVNSQNLVVIGAGQGATLGLMWLAEEWQRVRLKGTGVPGNPEGRDALTAIWLTPSLSLGTINHAAQVHKWVEESAKKKQSAKTSMVFVYGKEDTNSATWALDQLKTIIPDYKRVEGFEPKDPDNALTGEFSVAVKNLSGSQLLDKELPTVERILKYLDKVQEKKKPETWVERDFKTNVYAWTDRTGRPILNPLAKTKDEKMFNPVPLRIVGMSD